MTRPVKSVSRQNQPHRPILPVGFHCSRRSRAGFSLVEIMVVVLIISVLAMLAVPAFSRIQRKAKTSVIVNDFRVFGGAFETYSQEMGKWPAEAAAGVYPAGMDQRLNPIKWLRVTPMGGKYDWEYKQLHFGITYAAAIAISSATGAPLTLDIVQLTDLEHAIDGASQLNWLGGNFHIGSGLNPLFIIQP